MNINPDLLFAPYVLGAITLRNRLVMAPLTRCRAGQPGNVPTPLNAEYYRQRASAGLIISEATQVCQTGQGYPATPGIHTAEQVAGWRMVTDAVHAAGGRIFMQLWHVGRVSHPAYQPGHGLPVAPSAIAAAGKVRFIDANGQIAEAPLPTPRALALEELPGIARQYAEAARNALQAGCDGVEVHSANGYLLDQFLNSHSNRRCDAYGGSAPNRVRLLLEVVRAVCEVWGAERVGVRLSPLGNFNDVADDNPPETFGYAAERLDELGLAYLHLVEPGHAGSAPFAAVPGSEAVMALMREKFRGTLLVCGGYDRGKAEAALAHGRADLIGFGRSFIANPDLPERLRRRAALNTPDPATFYGGGAAGYVDYPALA
ncbi:MAG: alkene reductase [Methylococcaceae bacterium]|nr:MAG: alkene reductase [Methylococcaceae bacterium]